MAQLVGRAIYRQAHGETKDAELVEKLQTEFAPELAVYMAAPEMKKEEAKPEQPAKEPPVTFQAYARERIVSTDYPAPGNKHQQNWFRYFLIMNGKLDDNFSVHMRYGQDDITERGRKELDGGYSGSNLHWLFLDGKIGHETNMKLGRQPLLLGYGFTADIGKWWDGVSFTWQHKKTQLKTGYFQRGDGRARDFFIVDAKQKVSPKFELVSSYIKDFGVDADGGARSGLSNQYPTSVMSTATIGGKWTFDKNVALRGEFGRNFSLFDNVKSHRHYDASNGYFLELDYKGAAAQHVGSWGTWLQYRDGGAGFDPLNNMTTLDKTLAMPSALNGTHGWEYGFSYVPIHHVVSTLKYWNLRSDGITRNRPCAAAFHRPDCRPHAVQHASERFEADAFTRAGAHVAR